MIEPKQFPLRDGCRCGGSCHSGKTQTLGPRHLLSAGFSTAKNEGECACGGRACPRQYLAITGFILGAFVIVHLSVNMLGFWPTQFQVAVDRIHSLGVALPVLEMGLIFIPLTIHVALGLGTLWPDKLRPNVRKQHRGSEVRYWLQRVTAMILLGFLAFHLATMRQWRFHLAYEITPWLMLGPGPAGGLFEPQRAVEFVSNTVWHFWDGHTANPANLLIVQFYLLGLASAVYHLANGVATGAEVLGFVTTIKQKEWCWRLCTGVGLVLAAVGMAAWYAFAAGTRH
jgi:succinate dehydrogenase / fumarate reductase cytochrome b subunit